ncbi:MAG TPA: type II secretion system F family protein [Phycisphaerae bacterium]|nr:type II secretion system F family protein [Phycisphaerae bacterium]
MPAFAYVARDDTGALVEGEVSAASPAEAAKIIRGDGKFVVRIAPQGSRAAAKPKPAGTGATSFFGEKFRPEDLIYFTNQLAVMVETGVSLADALDACKHEGNSPRFARALDAVIDQVNGGSEFSAALAEHPKVFPAIYVALIKASEASGMMGPMLERLAQHLGAQREMTKKIKGAVTYPIVMFVFAIGVTIFLMTYVLPKFSAIYAGREATLPAATRALMAFSGGLVSYGPYVLGALVLLIGGAVWYLRTPEGRVKIDAVRFRIPVIGPLFHQTYLARSLHTLGTMIQSGVSVLDAVSLTSNVCGSLAYERMWNAVRDRIESGKQVSDALADYEHVPKAIKKMISAGERGGQLGPVMERVARHCESDLNVSIKTLTSMIEPAIVMFLGVIVGGLVLALLLPIFTISKALH